MNNSEAKKTYQQFDSYIRRFFNSDTKISVIRYTTAFIGVIIFGAIMVAAQGEDPINAAKLIVTGAFGNKVSIGNTLRWAMPCMLTGAASIIATKSGVINLGIEGQLYVGAFTAALVGWLIPMPAHLHAVVCIIAAGLAGVLWVIIPAIMRLYFSLDEYVTTMMMNFIATLLCDFLTLFVILPMRGITTTTAQTGNILDSAKLTTIVRGTSFSTGYIVGVVVCILVFMLFKYTILGYELKQVGENLKFAKTGGVDVKKTFIAIFIISGFIAGMCGGIEVCGGYYRYVSNFSTSMGWEGTMIADISRRNPLSLIAVSVVWGALKTGSMNMERGTSLNRLTVNLMKMVFVLLVAIDYEGIVNYFKVRKQKRIDRKKMEEQLKEEAAS
jgi:simple sugar transport system permease protein